MSELKTQPTNASVEDFLNAIADVQVRADCWTLVAMMRKVTEAEPQMWGPSIVGFGSYRYVNTTRREAEWPVAAFSPRKQNISVYLMCGFEQNAELMARLGTHSCGKSCLYIKRLSDIHQPTLEKLIRISVREVQMLYPPKKKTAPRSSAGAAKSVAKKKSGIGRKKRAAS